MNIKSDTVSQSGYGEQLRHEQAWIAEEMVNRQYLSHPQLMKHYGANGREKCLEDANYHLAQLADAMDAGAPSLFASYVGWVKILLGKRGVPTEEVARYLEMSRTTLGERLKGEAGSLAVEYLSAGLAELPSLPMDIPTFLVKGAPHVELARRYLDLLLKGDRHTASQMILGSASSGIPVKELYLHVFQPAQYEVGRLWEINEIGIAQEHYCTAATQFIISQLYPYIFSREHSAGTLVATCVAGDLHEIGVRMVADFFEMDGWNTFYLGGNTPCRSVIETVVQRRAWVLGISAMISFDLSAVKELIRAVRAHSECGDVKILVGGWPFLAAPGLWRKLGADGTATNAQEAIILANQLCMERRPARESA
ncbi:MAG TPA: cobalamin-dependent protein [Terriglobales bacterium]|nr:cobalamin-dependent protein [Terriglobales bacterium]